MTPTFRPARRDDLAAIVRLLADDELGRTREASSGELDPAYGRAWEEIEADPRNVEIEAELDGEIVGCLQLTFIPSLTLRGSQRAQVEGVRVAAHLRGRGLGTELLQWAIEQARTRGCGMVQLTTHKSRREALPFYQSLGFLSTNEALKLELR